MSGRELADWLGQVEEEILDPDRRIVDPHHHLWLEERGRLGTYGLPELWADTGSGHRVLATVFVECRASYHAAGPEHLRSVGETEMVAELAELCERGARDCGEEGSERARIAGIVAWADLTDGEHLDEVLRAHEEAGRGLFRGIRHSGACDPEPEALTIPGRGAPGLYADEAFRAGVRRLGELGLTYDTWHYHHQNRDYAELASACPETTMVLDHFGTPLGVGRFAGRRDEIFESWLRDIDEIARRPNVVAKLGGLAMPDNGFGWERAERPATSDELVEAQGRYYHHAIECFGPERCMFESNFPVDKLSISYAVLWNALKKIASRYSPSEQDAMFHGTASRVYRIA